MFKSFFLGGFECATGYNRHGQWIDLLAATWHDQHADEDYRRLREVGILAARDAIRWPLVDQGRGRYDFSSVQPLVRAARRHGVCVIWDLFHYGFPADVDLLSSHFPERFADHCAACARHLRSQLLHPLWFTPFNEPSFFSWAAGQDAQFAPHLRGCGPALKVALARASIQAVNAIRAEVPSARFLHADQVCRVVPADPSAHTLQEVQRFNDEAVFESWDMISGRLRPELGGSRAHLDVVGINHYWTCQWTHGQPGTWLADDDPRRLPLRDIVRLVWQRYGGELLIAETSHWGEHRAPYLRQIGQEVEALLAEGVPLRGVCLYPILGMCEWHEPDRWLPMGLWELDRSQGMRRQLHVPMGDALRQVQARLLRTAHRAGWKRVA